MGTIIRSTGICKDPSNLSILDLAESAGEQCIASAGIDKKDIDLVISTGIYRDDNVVEPAMAALIQQRLGINLKIDWNHRTFAFDILNGCAAQCGQAPWHLATGTVTP
jgi:3-oxoacyl-[acyl-carrier-protein] synthase-3